MKKSLLSAVLVSSAVGVSSLVGCSAAPDEENGSTQSALADDPSCIAHGDVRHFSTTCYPPKPMPQQTMDSIISEASNIATCLSTVATAAGATVTASTGVGAVVAVPLEGLSIVSGVACLNWIRVRLIEASWSCATTAIAERPATYTPRCETYCNDIHESVCRGGQASQLARGECWCAGISNDALHDQHPTPTPDPNAGPVMTPTMPAGPATPPK